MGMDYRKYYHLMCW